MAVTVIEGGQVFFVRTDHIGRPVFATDGAGTKVWEGEGRPGRLPVEGCQARTICPSAGSASAPAPPSR